VTLRESPVESPRLSAGVAEFALTSAATILAMAASATGVFVPDVYRDPAAIVPAMRGQDLVTLLLAPALIAASGLAVRGSHRARLVEIGLLGYLVYTYAGAAFGYRFNRLILVYIAAFSTSAFALVHAVRQVHVPDLSPSHRTPPRRAVAVFLLVIAGALTAIELREIGGFLATGVVPESVRRAGDATFFPYVLDLGVVVPLAVLTGIGLWKHARWSALLAGVLLVKTTTMGAALLSMNWLTERAGLPPDGLDPFYGVLALGGFGLPAGWFTRVR
jgi:hypothetical protein